MHCQDFLATLQRGIVFLDLAGLYLIWLKCQVTREQNRYERCRTIYIVFALRPNTGRNEERSAKKWVAATHRRIVLCRFGVASCFPNGTKRCARVLPCYYPLTAQCLCYVHVFFIYIYIYGRVYTNGCTYARPFPPFFAIQQYRAGAVPKSCRIIAHGSRVCRSKLVGRGAGKE